MNASHQMKPFIKIVTKNPKIKEIFESENHIYDLVMHKNAASPKINRFSFISRMNFHHH